MPIDDAWRVVKALPERQIMTTPDIPTKHRQDYYGKTAHPSISDERLADAYYDKEQDRHDVDDSGQTYGGLGEPVSFTEEYQDTNRGKNSLLTRVKQMPMRFLGGLNTWQQMNTQDEKVNRDQRSGEGRYAGTTESEGYKRYQRDRNDIMRQGREWANRMSWADANQANEEAQAQMQAGTLEMQPVPQPPDPSKMMMANLWTSRGVC